MPSTVARGILKRIMTNRTQLIVVVLALFGLPVPLRAELKPEEIAIIAVRQSKQSLDLAKYYAQARGIPKTQICVLDIPPGEIIPGAISSARNI